MPNSFSSATVPFNGRRCHSAPPYALPDVGAYFYSRTPRDRGLYAPLLTVGFPLNASRVTDMHILPNGSRVMSATRLLVLDGQRVLKMYPPLVDVQSIVDNMRLASGILPVARVHEFGRSGNCGYILMDFIQGHVLATVFHQYGAHAAAIVEPQILEISRRLSSIGLAHNDLEDRNIIVDDEWRIVGIIDWDFSAPAVRSTDYRYRLDPYSVSVQRWSYAFLRDCDGFGASLDANPVGGTSKLGRYGQPLIDTARLGVIPLSQRVIPPWSEFLQTLYPWPDAFRVALVLFDSGVYVLQSRHNDADYVRRAYLIAFLAKRSRSNTKD
ncbi:hypothetical protein EVJ58_g6842 [Rhodofomes roseus]|uniref:Aminoglycoside phosphotransferase domain-containing protein n=1 Tax=Rhodofomes roseus TaxID=34475 RepID=A0A4Y9Y842_9APHY|nr:hypothetical protein EVJ58_g6842 [Rhodofomes roseus]